MGSTTEAAHTEVNPDTFGLVGTALAQKFRVESVVARGGFGVLYRGVHLTLGRPIAIKVLRIPERIERAMHNVVRDAFEQEARTIARLSHPAIVHVIEYGVETSLEAPILWMVLEWIDGQTLGAVLKERHGRRYAPAEALEMTRPMLQALAYAHERGVAHRDLKPANIMVVGERHNAGIKLIDFGIAKSMDEDESVGSGDTRTQSVVTAFSPRYATPEQLGRARTGPWTDVHAAALILTEMLIGHPAYTTPPSDPTGLFAEAMSPQRPTPGKFGINVGAWEPVLQRAMALRVVERYADAAQLLEDLERNLPVLTDASGGAPGTGASQPSEPSTPSMTGGFPSPRGVAHVSQTQPRRTYVVVAASFVLLGAVAVLWIISRDRPTRADVPVPHPMATVTSAALPPTPATPPILVPAMNPAATTAAQAAATPPTVAPLADAQMVAQPDSTTATTSLPSAPDQHATTHGGRATHHGTRTTTPAQPPTQSQPSDHAQPTID